ncbi:hypothetical protein AQUCO_05300139v1 [Aquilegia coerulea]|uniref:PH domain-containing protein n=1 Tax=Aquilegia coerulea TaxID=218851 RepID=A0A2G5CIH3_AQUCA|nr:hypothetical protein AQUCO_05300139v1 [Aquilegia coerulea]
MLAHKFVEQSTKSDVYLKKQKTNKSWWSLGWTADSVEDESEPWRFGEEDWERLNKIIGYKESDGAPVLESQDKENTLQTSLEVHMKHNASKLVAHQQCLAELSCEGLDCFVMLYSEAKVFDLKLGSYRLSSPHGLLAESATIDDSLVGVFTLKPFGTKFDWSLVAKASPCYMTYIKNSIDQITKFFESGAVSQSIALETAAAVQMTIDEVKRTAQQQVTRALKDHARFLLDLDIAAPKITIPTNFCPDGSHGTKLLLDLGNLMLHTQDENDLTSPEENDMYLQFNLGLSDVSAFLVDGDYHWSQSALPMSGNAFPKKHSILPVIDKCGIVLNLQQIRAENLSYPSTRIAARLPSLGFHFSPASYHRLMQVVKIFQNEDNENSDYVRPWDQADIEGWSSILVWKGVGNREAAWRRRYICLVGPFLYVLESPESKTYKHFLSLRGKQVYQVPTEFTGNVEHVLALSDAGQPNSKVVEDVSALILRFDSDDSRRTWQGRFQGAIYRASVSATVTAISDTSSDSGDTEAELLDESNVMNMSTMEKFFITGVLDELKVSFSYSCQSNQGFKTMLLSEESPLFEFRAKGGQVELSTRGNDMLIGAVLKSLEIEDLVFCEGNTRPRYLAKSLIKNTDILTVDAMPTLTDVGNRTDSGSDIAQNDGEDDFFEASENLGEFVDCQAQSPGNVPKYLSAEHSFPSGKMSIKPPSFSRIAGLLPDSDLPRGNEDLKLIDTLDSFVKAQIVIYDQMSPLYNNIDKQVTVTLATLSFFCHRPTILAVLEFVNAINIEDEKNNLNDKYSAVKEQDDSIDEQNFSTIQEPVVKGLLGKGKSRVIFYLSLNMARAQIILMNENGTQLATLSQNHLLTDIKVFPSSFSIKAALGNLKISDDSLPGSHSYFWVCDMRNSGGTSFVEEIASYFMGLVPKDSKSVVKLKDQVTNSEKWFTTSEIEGSPALKLDLSLRKPIIVMPRRTDSHDFLELDVVHITVQNTFQWLCGDRNEMGAVHLEIMTIQVEDINLTVGTRTGHGESIIKDVKGLSVVLRRSLRDLLHQIPTTAVAVKIDVLKAALSNKEYQIITECALSNISETPNNVPPLTPIHVAHSDNLDLSLPVPSDAELESLDKESWITMTVLVAVSLVELSLHSGVTRDAALATVQASGAWLLYKSNSLGDGFLSATLKGFAVIDDREGTQQEHRLAIGKSERLGYSPLLFVPNAEKDRTQSDNNVVKRSDVKPVPTMLILDAKLNQSLTSVSICIQRPQLLVALDFLLAVVEFFVPTVRNIVTNEEDQDPLHVSAIIPDQSTYSQPSNEFSLSPQRPLIIDNERFDHYIYDGKGGVLHLQDRDNLDLSIPSIEPIIFVGNGKSLQFKNVHVKNGKYLDSAIYLGANSRYSASETDHVYLENENGGIDQNPNEVGDNSIPAQAVVADQSTQFIIEFQYVFVVCFVILSTFSKAVNSVDDFPCEESKKQVQFNEGVSLIEL